MNPDLYLEVYRQQDRELRRRLERRRVAAERAAAAGPVVTARTARGSRQHLAAPVRALGARLDGVLARGRRAVADAAAPQGCCSPA